MKKFSKDLAQFSVFLSFVCILLYAFAFNNTEKLVRRTLSLPSTSVVFLYDASEQSIGIFHRVFDSNDNAFESASREAAIYSDSQGTIHVVSLDNILTEGQFDDVELFFKYKKAVRYLLVIALVDFTIAIVINIYCYRKKTE